MANASKNYKSLISSLHKNLQCPVCLETVKTPFKLCVRGHGVCLACITNWAKCPLCRGVFTLENPVCVKNLLEALPHLCRYSDDGCEEVVEPGSDHEMFCGHRPIDCFRGCSVKVPITQLMGHYKAQHPRKYVCEDKTTSTSWNFNLKRTKLGYSPVFLFNNWFWLIEFIDVKEEQFKVFFQATPIGKLKHNYYARVTFEKDDFIYTYTLKATVLSECKFEDEDEKYCMKVPQSELQRFTDEDGLNCNYVFFREELG